MLGAPGPDSGTWDSCQLATGKGLPGSKSCRSFSVEYGAGPALHTSTPELRRMLHLSPAARNS